ncbi:lamin tail domain-containing protein [Bacteroidia bacterium]|nr:lamin tail domain-containing protein [Bacteroidia bacterium]MDB9882082.1 lamin tail domain-containing protein [Bacteroidia bacterium]
MKKIYTLLAGLILSVAASAQCSDLYFSEYAEGSSNNKYLEIFNPSDSTIDLSDYSIYMINNGGTSNNIGFQLYGNLDAKGLFILSTNQADTAAIMSKADTVFGYNSVCHFNGDDAVCLIKGTDTIDVIGERWVRSNWTVGTGSTKDYTLVRKSSVGSGQTDWTVGATEWDVYAKDDWTNLGSHVSACDPSTATEPATAAQDPTQDAVDVISIYSESYTDPAGINYFPNWGQTTQYSVFEIGTDSMIKYSALNYQGIDFNTSEIDASSMEMLHIDIWTADVDDIDIFPISRGGEKAVKKTLTAGEWNSIDIPLSDYTSQGLSMSDIIQVKFDNLGTSRETGTIFIDNIYFWKEPTLVYTVSTIADVIQLDADLAPTNEDELYELTGVVYGVDLDGNAGLSFTIIDATAGMNIHSFVDVSDYVVTEGDEITARGYITFYRGLLELRVDSIKVNSAGNALKDAVVVTNLSEATESDFIKLEKVWLADTTTVWPYGNVSLTNANQDTFTMRIDNSITDVVGTAVTYDTMNITGLGGQFDASAPYDDGYQIFPRGLGDLEEYTAPSSVRDFAVEARVYPNPANNNITVIGSEKWNSYEVFSVLGVKVASGDLNNNNLSVGGLVEGTYFLQLKADEKNGVARFIINR